MSKKFSIGWIGTGLMGAPMSEHLLAEGYQVNVYNRTRSKAERVIKKGAIWYDTPRELTAASDIVITIIGFPKDVEECYFGEEGIFKATKKGQILIDMTTTKPGLAVKIAKEAKKIKASFIDAPVSGGELGAINANLSIMIGGERKIVARVLPVMAVLGKNLVYMGDAGAGQHAKMCNQITLAGTLIGVCEALIYGTKSGLDLNILVRAISKGAAGCWSLDVLAPKIISKDYSPGFTIDNFLKDIGIALEEARLMNLPLPGLALAQQLYDSVQKMGKGQLGNQALYLALELLANKQIE
jgi:3-hydroxyisobutyrate dehydrogenase